MAEDNLQILFESYTHQKLTERTEINSSGSNRRYFVAMRQLFVDNGEKKYDNVSMDFLSMGMSDDYVEAVAEGANMVRVGSAIFGVRNYAAPQGSAAPAETSGNIL